MATSYKHRSELDVTKAQEAGYKPMVVTSIEDKEVRELMGAGSATVCWVKEDAGPGASTKPVDPVKEAARLERRAKKQAARGLLHETLVKAGKSPEEAARMVDEAMGTEPGKISFKVSQKGAISVYGLQRMPITLYAEQWERIAEENVLEEILEFISQHNATLSRRNG